MKKLIAFFALVSLVHSVSAHDVTVKVALSPAGSFEAKTDKMKGIVQKDGAKFTAENLWVKTEEFKTDNSLRDEHFRKHLNFEKSPKITLTKVVAADGKGTGTLTVNEIPQPVNFTYKLINPKKIEATFKVKPSDFKLKEAKYMGIGVNDEVEVVANIDV